MGELCQRVDLFWYSEQLRLYRGVGYCHDEKLRRCAVVIGCGADMASQCWGIGGDYEI
jgi:hypothetical protein